MSGTVGRALQELNRSLDLVGHGCETVVTLGARAYVSAQEGLGPMIFYTADGEFRYGGLLVRLVPSQRHGEDDADDQT